MQVIGNHIGVNVLNSLEETCLITRRYYKSIGLYFHLEISQTFKSSLKKMNCFAENLISILRPSCSQCNWEIEGSGAQVKTNLECLQQSKQILNVCNKSNLQARTIPAQQCEGRGKAFALEGRGLGAIRSKVHRAQVGSWREDVQIPAVLSRGHALPLEE